MLPQITCLFFSVHPLLDTNYFHPYVIYVLILSSFSTLIYCLYSFILTSFTPILIFLFFFLSVTITTRLRVGRSGFDIRQEQRRHFLCLPPRPDLLWGPHNFLTNGYRVSFHRLKRPGREADLSPPPSTEIKNAWSCTSAPQCVFITWPFVKRRESSLHFTFHASSSLHLFLFSFFFSQFSDIFSLFYIHRYTPSLSSFTSHFNSPSFFTSYFHHSLILRTSFFSKFLPDCIIIHPH